MIVHRTVNRRRNIWSVGGKAFPLRRGRLDVRVSVFLQSTFIRALGGCDRETWFDFAATLGNPQDLSKSHGTQCLPLFLQACASYMLRLVFLR